jgi:hypothetical protein
MYFGVFGEMVWRKVIASPTDCGVNADGAQRRPSTFVSMPNSSAGTPYWRLGSRLARELVCSQPKREPLDSVLIGSPDFGWGKRSAERDRYSAEKITGKLAGNFANCGS